MDREKLKSVISLSIKNTLNEDEFKGKIKFIISESIKKILSAETKSVLESNGYRELKEKAVLAIVKYGKSETFKHRVLVFFESKVGEIEKSSLTFSSIIPSGFLNGLKVYIYNNGEAISKTLVSIIEQPSISSKIKSQITSIISNINPMASKFISSETVFQKTMSSIESYLTDSNNVIELVMILNNALDSISRKNISDFLANIPRESVSSLTKSSADVFINTLFSEDTIQSIINDIESAIIKNNTLYELSQFFKIYTNKLSSYIMNNFYNDIINSPEFLDLINQISHSISKNLPE